jgi:hypothetical protein
MALAIMADATKVAPGRIGEEDVRAKVDSLGPSHKTPTSARQSGQLYRSIDRNQDIDVFGDGLGCQDGAQQRDTMHPWASTYSPDEGKSGEQQRKARFDN